MPTPRVTARALIHRGKKFDFELLSVAYPGGKTLDRLNVRHPGAVVVVPILETPGGREVVLIRNFRVAAEEHLLECCAGTIERPRDADGSFGEGEDPAVCAARELIEETGYRAATLRPLGGPITGDTSGKSSGGEATNWFYTTPGLTDERMYAYAATGLTNVGQQLEEDETIEVLTVPSREAVDMAVSGRLRDAKSMLSILLADRAGLL